MHHRRSQIFCIGLSFLLLSGDVARNPVMFHHARVPDRKIRCVAFELRADRVCTSLHQLVHQAASLGNGLLRFVDESGLIGSPGFREAVALLAWKSMNSKALDPLFPALKLGLSFSLVTELLYRMIVLLAELGL